MAGESVEIGQTRWRPFQFIAIFVSYEFIFFRLSLDVMDETESEISIQILSFPINLTLKSKNKRVPVCEIFDFVPLSSSYIYLLNIFNVRYNSR